MSLNLFWDEFQRRLYDNMVKTPADYGLDAENALGAIMLEAREKSTEIRMKFQVGSDIRGNMNHINLDSRSFKQTFRTFCPGERFTQAKLKKLYEEMSKVSSSPVDK
jgi:hypothetical protein